MIKTHTCNLMFSYIDADNDSEDGKIVTRMLTGIDFIPNRVRLVSAVDNSLNGGGDFNATHIGLLFGDFLYDGLNSLNSKENILLAYKKSGNESIREPQIWQNCYFKTINTNQISMQFRSQAYQFNFIPVFKTGVPITWNAGILYIRLEFGLELEETY